MCVYMKIWFFLFFQESLPGLAREKYPRISQICESYVLRCKVAEFHTCVYDSMYDGIKL